MMSSKNQVRRAQAGIGNLPLKRSVPKRFFRSLLYEQQAGGANFFPGGRMEECLTLLYGPREYGFRFPEQRIGLRGIVLRRGLSNQIVKPPGLLIGDGDGLIAGAPR